MEAKHQEAQPQEGKSQEAQSQREHRWLQQLIGDWTSEAEMTVGPDKETLKSTGTEHVRSLGGLWILAEGQGEIPGGGTATMLLTIGYDPRKGRFVGTWVGSMMTHMWVYEGSLDADERVLTLESQGPVMTPDGEATGKTTTYRDVIELKSTDHRTLTSRMLGEDGKWHEFMSAHYRRQK